MAKKRRNPTRKERELQSQWEQIQSKWEKVQPFSGKYGGVSSGRISSVTLTVSNTPKPAKIPSRVTPGGSTSKKESPRYTGNKMIGIATLHKSCEVPVFQAEDAVAISRMRRG